MNPHTSHSHRSASLLIIVSLLLISIFIVPLFGVVQVAQAITTAYLNPSANSGIGFEVTPQNAYTDGAGVAQNMNGYGQSHIYYNYGITIPAGETITGIEVRVDGRVIDSTSGVSDYDVELSWNGGTNWSSTRTTAELSQGEQTFTLGSASDDWGHAGWTATDLNNTNFRVRITSQCTGGTPHRATTAILSLDWIAVRVTYNTPPNTPTNTTPAWRATVTDRQPDIHVVGLQRSQCGRRAKPVPRPASHQRRHLYGSTLAVKFSSAGTSTANTYTPDVTGTSLNGAYCWHVQVRDNSGASNRGAATVTETCFTRDGTAPIFERDLSRLRQCLALYSRRQQRPMQAAAWPMSNSITAALHRRLGAGQPDQRARPLSMGLHARREWDLLFPIKSLRRCGQLRNDSYRQLRLRRQHDDLRQRRADVGGHAAGRADQYWNDRGSVDGE